MEGRVIKSFRDWGGGEGIYFQIYHGVNVMLVLNDSLYTGLPDGVLSHWQMTKGRGLLIQLLMQ